jgi:hypothetical protein
MGQTRLLHGIGYYPCQPNLTCPYAGLIYFFSLFTAGTMTGFDASGHVAEETKNARYAQTQ